MKILAVVGARPQFVKHAPLSRALSKSHKCVLLHTGQHYDYYMNKVFFDELGIPEPDYNLGVGSDTHAAQTGRMMKGIEEVLVQEAPDFVIVYGDTNSTLAGALAAVKLHVRVGHVEAGLRVYDKKMPEEINRAIADYCSNYLFCPTETAVANLKAEGRTEGVYFTGDVMADALSSNKAIAERSDILELLNLKHKKYILITLHRPVNTDISENLESIVRAISALADSGETVVFPAHPRTTKVLKDRGLLNALKEKIKVIEPMGYLEFLKVMNHSAKIITDSGGIQKEAYILRVPCITLLENTTWVETVTSGWNILAGPGGTNILKSFRQDRLASRHPHVFDTGASEKIAEILGTL